MLQKCVSNSPLQLRHRNGAAAQGHPAATAAAWQGRAAASQTRIAAAASDVKAPAAPMELVKLPPEILAAGGLDPSKDNPANVDAFQQMLGTAFLPINMRYPGIRVQNIDPPVLT